jgi:membrane protease YdiL (CAAX protease family)
VLYPGFAYTPLILGIYFLLLIAALVLNAIVKDRKEYRRFTRLRSSSKRRRTMRKWIVQSFVFFGAASAVTLVVAWQFVALVLAELRGIRFISDFLVLLNAHVWIVAVVVAVIVGGGVLGIVAARRETEIPSVGDVQSLLPRNRAELKWGALLSINAGVVEELLFRLAMPALLFGITGNALLAAGISVVVFGLLHAYQGWPGIVGATIIGAVFMAIYVLSGTILVPIIVHALFDLRSLVLIPIVIKRVHLISPQS